MAFDPKLAGLVGDGYQARAAIELQELLAGAQVESVLKELDRAVGNRALSPDAAVGFCHELVAYRRLVSRLRGVVRQGEIAAEKLAVVGGMGQ